MKDFLTKCNSSKVISSFTLHELPDPSKVIRSVILNEFNDSHGTHVSLVRDYYSATSYHYKVIRSTSYSDYLVTYIYDDRSDAVAKFMYLITSILVI